MRRIKTKNKAGTIVFILCFLAPAVLHILIFWLGINIRSIQMAFTDYGTNRFSFGNFETAWRMLVESKDSDLARGFANTCKFFVVGLANVPLTLFAAYVIFKKMAFNRFVRIALYLPGAISTLMMARLFNQFSMADGVLGKIVELFGGSMNGTSLMTNEETALGSIIFFDIWIGLGGGLVLWFGAVGRIPPELLEYDRLEGVGEIKEFGLIVMPLLWPTFVTMITLQIVGFFGATGSVLVFTYGKYDTMTIGYWMYHIVNFGQEELYNIANAAAISFMLITLPVLVAARKFLNRFGREVEY